jgi:hypothetical protein
MTDPTPFERLLDGDTALVVREPLGPAVPVVLVEPDGTPHHAAVVDGVETPLRGMFDAAGTDVAPGASHAPVLSTAPVLHIQLRPVQAALGRPLSRRDGFIVRGRRYRVEHPSPDGHGMVACKLLETEDADG